MIKYYTTDTSGNIEEKEHEGFGRAGETPLEIKLKGFGSLGLSPNNDLAQSTGDFNSAIEDYLDSKHKNGNMGQKFNESKPQMSVLFKQFPDALKAIVRCSEYGHEKYKETDSDYINFKKVEGGSKVYADAGLRHRTEEGNDESNLPHQYHVAWNALAELQLWIEEQERLKLDLEVEL